MIQLTRLNNSPLIVNSDLIKFIENKPDTVLTLITGEKVVVLEPSAEVLKKVVEFRRQILVGGMCLPMASATEVEASAAAAVEKEEED